MYATGMAQVVGTTAPERAPMELAERGLCGEQLHGLLSGLLHVHLCLAPTPATACAPPCACGALPAAGPPGTSPAGHPELQGCRHCLLRRADAPEQRHWLMGMPARAWAPAILARAAAAAT